MFIYLDTKINKAKPITVDGTVKECPFCSNNPEKTNLLVDKMGPIRLVQNKFSDLSPVHRTVLIENDTCNYDLSNYTKEHLYNLIHFGIEKWNEMKDSGKYKSVAFFKNHGPYSGASIFHPHMQIVGFDDVDCNQHVNITHFEGITIYKNEGVSLNISTKPKTEYHEFNVILNDLSYINDFSDAIQNIVSYINEHLIQKTNSFNIAFYDFDNKIIAKIIPRRVTSIYYLGYSVSMVPTDLDEMADDIRNQFYN